MGRHSVSSTIRDITDMLMWHERSRGFSIDIDDQMWKDRELNFDQRILQVVLFNVLTNALKFQVKGRISISVTELWQ